MDNNYYIGIDIAKAKFDIAFFKKNGKVFENNNKGFKAFDALLKEKGIKQANITMESTNIYWEDLAFHLHKKKNIVVSVINPLRISAYAKAQLSRLHNYTTGHFNFGLIPIDLYNNNDSMVILSCHR